MDIDINSISNSADSHFEVQILTNALNDDSGCCICVGDIVSINEMPRDNWAYDLRGRCKVCLIIVGNLAFLRQVRYMTDTHIECIAWNNNYTDFTIAKERIKTLYEVAN